MTIDIHDSPTSWRRLCLTLLIGCIANAGMWMVIAVMPAMEAELGLSRADASLPYTALMIGFGVGNLLIGRIVDRFGVVIALWLATAGITLAYVCAALSPGVGLITLAHLLLGLGTAVGFGPLIADISHWFLRRRGIAVALVASGNYMAGAVWPLLLGGVLAADGWRAVYLFLAAVTVVTVLPLSLLLRARVPESAHETARVAAAVQARDVGLSPRALQYLLGLAGIGCCMAMAMPQVHIVAYCVGLGFGPAVGAEMLSVMLIGGVVSRVASGLLADQLGGVRTLLLGSVLQCIALFFYLPFDGLVSLYIVSLIFGLSQGGIVPSYALVVREYMPPKEAGARIGFVMMMTIMGMALGGWTSGWIYDLSGSYQWAFLNGIAWNTLNIAIMLWLLLRKTQPRIAAAA